MARTLAGLPAGIRVSDHISLGVIAGTFPLGEVRQVLAETGRASERERDLPAHVMVYYAIALALHAGAGTRGDVYVYGMSGDGRCVLLLSYASNIQPGDVNGDGDVFVHDRLTGETTLVSARPN